MGWVIFGLLVVTYWVFSSLWWPYTVCWWCKGDARHGPAGAKVWRNCWVCKGAGRRRRFGAWLFRRASK